MSTEATTLAEVLVEQAADHGDEVFLHFEDRTVSFDELNRNVNRVANGLAGLGVRTGTGVAIVMGNSPEWLYVYFATQKLGAYAVPVNVALKGEGLRYVIDHSDSVVVVVDPARADAVSAVADGTPQVGQVVVDATEAPQDWALPEGWSTLTDVMDAPDTEPDATIEPKAISAIMYTSGTTGAPKGVVTRYERTNIGGIRMLAGLLAPDEVLYTCLPLFHANALLLTSVRGLVAGLPVVLARRFSASGFWDEIRRYGVTIFNGLGAMIPILMKQPERDDDAENPVRVVFSAACPASVWEAFEDRFAVNIIEGYAAVDGGGFMTMNLGQSPKGSIGTSMTPIRVVDDEGQDVPVGSPGELLFEVDDPQARRVEYYKNRDAGDERIRDGWFHTGDLVTADEDGNLYFVDRLTDSLRRRGENISSWEVEREINRHDAVLESAVIGVPSELGEDDVMAVILPKDGHTITPEELIEHCEGLMADFMVPRYVEIRDSLPKTETHRVRKAELKSAGVRPATWDREAPQPGKTERNA
jgi:crotonobetaine/carnitine-CoA ligase